MSGPGHNGGPAMGPGAGWRRYAWGRARGDLLPRLPIEILRLRVRRAAELGVDYKSYASIRAASGHDVIAFLFSSNALRLDAENRIAALRAARLQDLPDCTRLALVYAPHDPRAVLAVNACLDAADRAPVLADSWRQARARLDGLRRARNLPGDGIVVIGETELERAWVATGRLAGFIPASRYFRMTGSTIGQETHG